MSAPRRSLFIFLLLLVAGFGWPASVPAFAGGPGEDAASPMPKPNVEKKIYTNDDLDALAARYGGPARQNAASTSAAPETPAAPIPRRTVLPNDLNPDWYAQQFVSMQTRLDDLDAQIAQLRQYIASPSAARAGGTDGVPLNGPFGGITTYNLLDQLMQQRQAIVAQMDAIEDMARVNGFPPGMLRASAQILQAAQSHAVATPQERRAMLVRDQDALLAQLGQVQDTLGSINQQAAAQNITLIPYNPAFGGSALTNNVQNLDNQASELQQKLSDIQDQARVDGIAPGALR